MISYLQGKIILKKENFIILETNGIGFQVFVSKKSLDKISGNGENFKLFCYLDIGERSLNLYGFLNYEKLELFKLLRNISGVGPKAALEISSLGPPVKIKKEIEKGNEKIFEGVPGIGKKKAKKIILELSGKLNIPASSSPEETLPEDDTILALINLGFKKEEAKKALFQVPQEIKDTQERIKRALKILGR